ncbi:MAG: hypothetical protein R3F33_15785 [Planctomycetota bacterium]
MNCLIPIAAWLCTAPLVSAQTGPVLPGVETLGRLGSLGSGPQVIALVETRLLAPGEDLPALLPSIERWQADLAAEGFQASAVAVGFEESSGHRDGRVLLGLRDWLRAEAEKAPLAGVLLVGRFPDALLVRSVNWRKQGKIEIDGEAYADVPYLRRVPEDVAHRADIVLADLDGNWEACYHEAPELLPSWIAAYPAGIPERGGPFARLETGQKPFEDFFLVDDGRLVVAEHSLDLDDSNANHEVAAGERGTPNILAQPDIWVGRLDARGTAMVPRPECALFDDTGQPVRRDFESKPPHWRDGLWQADARLERQLLIEYFERNHSYRTSGSPAEAWRPASIACGLRSGYREMASAREDWRGADAKHLDVGEQATLAQFVDWIAQPAVLRTVRAHSDPWGSVFGKSPTKELDAQLAPIWSWSSLENVLAPSLASPCSGGKLDWFLLHTLWRNHATAGAPAFYVHTGCEGISPPGWRNRPFQDAGYGVRQGGEALLFFGDGLALVGRAKVFYDEPRGFAAALGRGGTVGEAWREYFRLEAQEPGKGVGDIGRKRAYFWSLLGDPTLRLLPPRERDSGK